jgi:hypothetical protein
MPIDAAGKPAGACVVFSSVVQIWPPKEATPHRLPDGHGSPPNSQQNRNRNPISSRDAKAQTADSSGNRAILNRAGELALWIFYQPEQFGTVSGK